MNELNTFSDMYISGHLIRVFYDFQDKVVYPNGVKVASKPLKHLKTILSAPTFDKPFINASFVIFFTEKYIKQQKKHGLDRKATLQKFRDSSRYETMRSIYEYRVMCDGHGDVKERLGSFKNTFRVKFNNNWK